VRQKNSVLLCSCISYSFVKLFYLVWKILIGSVYAQGGSVHAAVNSVHTPVRSVHAPVGSVLTHGRQRT
jgi:hypothetical protein